jgi:ankyrin repeat protein
VSLDDFDVTLPSMRATLLHVAAEYGFFDAARLLLDRGANVNARADIDANGVAGRPRSFTPPPTSKA